ncbi:MAG: hypothetical protein ISS43_01540 [Candidatus Omnitrophica bacterium]|nr:hypothetical protein [Candidatus Omnitrophota bacterium]
MAKYRICSICKEKFLPSKYRRDQKVCSRKPCQLTRQRQNLAAWRQKNPGYFKSSRHNSSWAKLYRQRSQAWKKKHKGQVRRYKKAHKEEQREYMREYMYRLRHFKG